MRAVFRIQELAYDLPMTQPYGGDRSIGIVQFAFACGLSRREQLIRNFGQRADHDHGADLGAALDDARHASHGGGILNRSPTKLEDDYISSYGFSLSSR